MWRSLPAVSASRSRGGLPGCTGRPSPRPRQPPSGVPREHYSPARNFLQKCIARRKSRGLGSRCGKAMPAWQKHIRRLSHDHKPGSRGEGCPPHRPHVGACVSQGHTNSKHNSFNMLAQSRQRSRPKLADANLADHKSPGDQVMSKPFVLKTPARKALGLGVLLVLAILSCRADAMPANGGNTVQGFYDALLNTMRNGRTLGQSGRFTQLEPVIRSTFDIPSMARLSVGPSWPTLTEAQRQQVTESLGRYISAIYADRFDSYSGQKLQVTGEQPAGAGLMVRSQIVKVNGEPVNVDYMLRRSGDSWLIADIYLDGAISELATRRSEFSAVLKNEGVEGLIAALDRKSDLLISR